MAKYEYNDGGREAAGFKGSAGDCAVRALSIVTGREYNEVYKTVGEFCKLEKPSKSRRGISSPRKGARMGWHYESRPRGNGSR